MKETRKQIIPNNAMGTEQKENAGIVALYLEAARAAQAADSVLVQLFQPELPACSCLEALCTLEPVGRK